MSDLYDLSYFFDFQVIPILPTKFQLNMPFGSEEEAKIGFQDGAIGFSIGTIIAIFYLKVTPILSTKFRVNWPRGVEVGF